MEWGLHDIKELLSFFFIIVMFKLIPYLLMIPDSFMNKKIQCLGFALKYSIKKKKKSRE